MLVLIRKSQNLFKFIKSPSHVRSCFVRSDVVGLKCSGETTNIRRISLDSVSRCESSVLDDMTSADQCRLIYLKRPNDKSNTTDLLKDTLASSQSPEIPSLKHTSCNDLISTLVDFDESGHSSDSRVMQTLLMEISQQMKEDPTALSLHAMANFTIYVHRNRQFMHKYLMCGDMLDTLLHRLESCDNFEDFDYITLCYSNLNRVLTEDLMELYKTKMEQLMRQGQLSRDSMTILRMLNFLNKAPWAFRNTVATRTVLQSLLPHIEELSDQLLAHMLTIWIGYSEPGEIAAPILALAEKRLAESPEQAKENIHLLFCCSISARPEKIAAVAKYLREYMSSTDDRSSALGNNFLYQTLRRCGKSETEMFNKYWSKVTTELANCSKESPDYTHKLMNACFRYCFFQDAQRVLYRYKPFEAVALRSVNMEFKDGISTLLPSKFAILAMFMVSFGSHPVTHRFSEDFVQNIESIHRQMSVQNLKRLAYGVELFYKYGNCKPAKSMRSRMHNDVNNHICRIENVIDDYVERFIASPHRHATNLNNLLSIYKPTNSPKRTVILDKLIKFYDEQMRNIPLSTRFIRDSLYNIGSLQYSQPMVFANMLRYLYDNRTLISGGVVARALYTLYSSGYEPRNQLLLSDDGPHVDVDDVRFEEFGKIIERDFELIPSLSILRTCLALTFYQALSMELIRRIFDEMFFTRMEEEITQCVTNQHYIAISMNSLMQLNRAVCFNYPEANIPWLQQNYIEAQMSSSSSHNTKFHDDIYRILLNCLPDKDLIDINHVTPYGYRIPFVLYLNSNREFVRPPAHTQKSTFELIKIAILPLKNDSFCRNSTTLRGDQQLQEQHLGMLGYSVVQIGYSDWNEMQMNIPGAKEAFLRKILKEK